MNRTYFLVLLLFLSSLDLAASEKPNIIYLMLDEWGYFESGHMGHPELITPNIDRFASEGLRFTNAYAGAPVCGPTRCVLMTGLHSGHTSMRVNDGFSPIRADEPTLGTMLKQAGYVTGGFGKWGIGGRGTSGVPEKHGFDDFFGYYDQVHAHTFYPRYLVRNSREVFLRGNNGDSFYEGETHVSLRSSGSRSALFAGTRTNTFSVIYRGHHHTDCGASTKMILPGSCSKTCHGLRDSEPIAMRVCTPLSCTWWIARSVRYSLC